MCHEALHLRELRFHGVVDAPVNDTHLSRIAQARTSPFDQVLLVGAVNEIMTLLTEREQIIGAIATRLTRLDVTHIENLVLGLALAPLTGMVVPCQHILADVPEAELWPLLIVRALNLRLTDFLEVELCHLNGYLVHR